MDTSSVSVGEAASDWELVVVAGFCLGSAAGLSSSFFRLPLREVLGLRAMVNGSGLRCSCAGGIGFCHG